LAQGTPLILAGDEVGSSQSGNNNAYCQDNPIGWVDWSGLGRKGKDMTELVAQLTSLRRAFPQLRSRRWVEGRRADGSYGVLWLTPAAEDMKESDWKFPEGRFLAYVLGPMEQGQAPIFIVLNAAPEEIAFKLPKMNEYKSWQQVLNTADANQATAGFAVGGRQLFRGGHRLEVDPKNGGHTSLDGTGVVVAVELIDHRLDLAVVVFLRLEVVGGPVRVRRWRYVFAVDLRGEQILHPATRRPVQQVVSGVFVGPGGA